MVSLKGTKDGLLITLGEGEWRELLADLASQLERPGAAGFFRGAYARVDSGDRTLSDFEQHELNGLLELHEMRLDDTPVTELMRRYDDTIDGTSAPPVNGQDRAPMIEALMVRRTVRSGQVVTYSGDIVVYGDVNPGGEIIAGGDVLVWGKLRGVVHAGATGDDRAVVGALLLAPTQLRIGTHIARAPDPQGRKKNIRGAELARVREGRILIESWTA
jgi:septum site-determining protein MinC